MKKAILIPILFINSLIFSDTTIVALNQVHHSFGSSGNNRTAIETIQFPTNETEYSSISMRVDLECPNGGCDPWDRKAKISVYHLDQWIEIGRYVTPYGIECGWDIDVTDYRSLFKGEVQIRSFIDTWVQPGWLVSIEFDFVSGSNEFPYTVVRNLWNYDRLVYGDPTIPIDIATINEYLPNDTEEAYIRITTTGHGQGNTENAAEFSDKKHNILINSETAYIHDFWRSDCEFNQCSPQNGTWQYDRAGFCPGDKVTAQNFSVLDFSLPGNSLQLEYELEDYTNLCSPNNSSCVNGVTCSSCSYNNTGHTEPFYYIGSQLIIHTTSKHSNADAYMRIAEPGGPLSSDSSLGKIDIYLENYIPVYGISFNINIDQLSGVGLENISFQNGQGGRAEESGWTVGLNNSGFVVALSQGDGNPIQPGEGVFTQVEWNIEELPQVSGIINISDLEVSGYFGSELSFEIGPSRIVEENLALSDIKNIPEYYVLHKAYPNPFNPLTTINYDLPKDSFVRIDVYDLMGRQIKTLVNEKIVAGYRSIHWNATNNLSQPVSAGLYIYTIQAEEFMKTKKMVLIK